MDGDLVGGGDLLERLRSLEVEDEAIASRFLYFEPEEPLADPASLIEPSADAGGRLAVLDGFNPLLFLHGCDPDKGVGIEPVHAPGSVNPLREAGAAVVLSDNVAKAKEARGGWAIGSERKKSAVEVQLGMTTVEPFGRGRTGKFKLTVQKDRPGYLERPEPRPVRARAAISMMAAAHGAWSPITRSARRASSADQPDGEGQPLPRATCAPALFAQADRGRRQGQGSGIRTAIDRLVAEGYAVEFAGSATPASSSSTVPLPRVGRVERERVTDRLLDAVTAWRAFAELKDDGLAGAAPVKDERGKRFSSGAGTRGRGACLQEGSMSRPPASERLANPEAVLSRSDLRELGYERRAIHAIFRASPLAALPGYSRPLVRADDLRELLSRCTYRNDAPRVRP